ncbi:alpha/beta fold hydrolase [Labilithrix luteola]|nr:alpha/beta hydrolase [Labilithrix luteola]
MNKLLVGLVAFASSTAFFAGDAFAGELHPTRYLHFNGNKVAVYESRGHEGPGILLLHGNTSAADSYKRILEGPLGSKRHLVAVDLSGYGESDNAASYSTAFFAQEIAYVAQQTGVADGIVVGWSLGGDLALQAAPLLPNAKGFFLFGTAPVGYTPTLPPAFLSPTESYAGPAVSYGFIAGLTQQQITDYVTAFFRPNYRNVPQFMIADGLRTDPNTRTAVYLAGTGQDPTTLDEVAVIRNLHVPVELALGSEDAFVNPAYMDALAPSIPTLHDGHVRYVQHAGHALHYEDPIRFTLILEDFIRDAECAAAH